jgi:hypothetical protein
MSNLKLDQTDYAMLSLLQKDGRASNVKTGKQAQFE